MFIRSAMEFTSITTAPVAYTNKHAAFRQRQIFFESLEVLQSGIKLVFEPNNGKSTLSAPFCFLCIDMVSDTIIAFPFGALHDHYAAPAFILR
jgi:hypothetical protein